jgi:hypothetical protein
MKMLSLVIFLLMRFTIEFIDGFCFNVIAYVLCGVCVYVSITWIAQTT